MKLSDHEQAMLAGAEGAARQYAMEQIVRVGSFFGAEDCVKVSQVHLMADPESLGPGGSRFLRLWPNLLKMSAGCVFPPSPIRAVLILKPTSV